MATKTFTTDFSLNKSQSVGLAKAVEKAHIVEVNDNINATFYGKDNSSKLQAKFGGVFGN